MNQKLNFSPFSESSKVNEGLHADTNRDFKNGSLLHCIRSRHEYDNRRWQQLEVGATKGVHYKARKNVVQATKTRIKVRARSHAPKPTAAAKPRKPRRAIVGIILPKPVINLKQRIAMLEALQEEERQLWEQLLSLQG
ncbi:hypothetical protein DFS34DRAFT_646890 [Phlyctochytrium arcticum]|nr:hypothetical protein DFS34DRAFT_646890 [Phlyctochytrium arcticum]